MIITIPVKRPRQRASPSPLGLWLNGGEARDILCPTGYTPLSRNPDVLRCTYKIADLVSNMTIMLMENGVNGDERIRDELAKKLDVYPCSNMVRKNFIIRIVTDMVLYGNSVALPHLSGTILEDIEPLKASDMQYEKAGRGYVIRTGGTVLQPDEVLHFVLNPDEDKPFMGQGMKPMVCETVQNLLQQNATKTGFLKSKWKPSMIVSVNAEASELLDEGLRAQILGSYTKTTEAGEPWLIPSNELKVEKIQPLTLNDLAIQDGITLDLKALAATMGLPPYLVGAGSFNKDEYNNFISTTICSFATIIQQEITKKLLTSPTRYAKFNPKSLMQYNLSEKVSFTKEMVGGGMLNRNEARAEFDYSPVDDNAMNRFTVLENYLEVKDLGKQKKLNLGGDEYDK